LAGFLLVSGYTTKPASNSTAAKRAVTMKLMQDSTQKLSTASLLGVGTTTSNDGGKTNSNRSKKMVFADDLRQQISEAVATRRPRQLLTSATEPDVRKQNFAQDIGKPSVAESLAGASAPTDTAISPPNNAARTVAAGGSFLPLSDSALPTDSDLPLIDASINTPFSEGELDLAIDVSPAANLQESSDIYLGIINPLADASHNLIEVSAWMPRQNPLTASALQGPALINTDVPSVPTEAESVEPGLPGINLVQSQPVPIVSARVQHAQDVMHAEQTVLGELDSETTHPVESDTRVSQFPANLTAAYDLSLPEIMPEGTFALTNAVVTDVSTMLLRFKAQLQMSAGNQETLPALLTPDTAGQTRLMGAGQATSAMDVMQGLQRQADLLAPTKSLLSDQQLLANVAALSSESSVSSQSASLYSADQRLQQAAEARQAHLQGTQASGTTADAAMARASGTMMAAMDVSFGQAGWAERIGRQILLQSAQGNSTAQIQLDPPELGSLVIKLQIVDQTATVNFASPHAMVRDALEQQVQRLQEMFKEQGMNLLDVSVSDQSANSRQDSERQSAKNANSSERSGDPSEQESPVIVRQSMSLIDYYA
jgi:flagellar hook-length control protein FliK